MKQTVEALLADKGVQTGGALLFAGSAVCNLNVEGSNHDYFAGTPLHILSQEGCKLALPITFNTPLTTLLQQ